MKSSEWLRPSFFSLSFHFAKHVMLTSLLLGFLFTLPALPSLWNQAAAHVGFTYKLVLLSKILLFGFVGGLIPFFIARLGALFLFPTLEPSAQLLTSFVIFVFTTVLNILAAIAENPVLASEYHGLGFLVSGGSATYRSVLMLLWITVFGVAAIRKIREPFSSTLRATRAMSLVLALAAVLVVDWQLSAFYRRIDPANRDAALVHKMTLMVPQLTKGDVETILNTPALDEWKANLRFSADVRPSSESELAQIVSLLSGMQPWQHGIRKDYLNPDEQRTLSEHLSHIFSESHNANTHILTLGTTSSVADVLGGRLAQLCNLNPDTSLAIRTAEKMMIAYAQIPEKMVSFLFPETRCTQKLSPLSHLALQELQSFGRLFQKKGPVQSLWWIDPATGTTEAPEELANRRLSSLRSTLIAIDAHLNLLDLRRNTRIQIVGLGRRNNGSLTVVSEEPEASLASMPVVPKNTKPLLTSAQGAKILANTALDNNTPAYTESPQWENIPPTDSEEARAAFYAKRTLICGWKTENGIVATQFVLKPTPSEVTTHTESLDSFSLLFPIQESRVLCQQYAHQTFKAILEKDNGLGNKLPLIALYNAHVSEKSWQEPAAEQTPAESPSLVKEPVAP